MSIEIKKAPSAATDIRPKSEFRMLNPNNNRTTSLLQRYPNLIADAFKGIPEVEMFVQIKNCDYLIKIGKVAETAVISKLEAMALANTGRIYLGGF